MASQAHVIGQVKERKRVNSEEEKWKLSAEAVKANGHILIVATAGSSVKKYEKQARKAIKQLRKIGAEALAWQAERSLEERLREVGK